MAIIQILREFTSGNVPGVYGRLAFGKCRKKFKLGTILVWRLAAKCEPPGGTDYSKEEFNARHRADMRVPPGGNWTQGVL